MHTCLELAYLRLRCGASAAAGEKRKLLLFAEGIEKSARRCETRHGKAPITGFCADLGRPQYPKRALAHEGHWHPPFPWSPERRMRATGTRPSRGRLSVGRCGAFSVPGSVACF